MKPIIVAIVILAICISLPQPLFSAESNFKKTVRNFIITMDSNNRDEIADLVVYPLHRRSPLPSINTRSQFLQHFDEIFDEQLLRAISNSSIESDWAEVGWRGIMFKDGMLWLDDDGKITAVNYQTEKAKRERARLIESERRKLHSSLQQFLEPILEWKTKDYLIRIDRTQEDQYRCAVWPVDKSTSEKPDLIMNDGKVIFEGSGGNHYYDFNHGIYLYRCSVNIIRTVDTPYAVLNIYKDNKAILSQPVVEVIYGR